MSSAFVSAIVIERGRGPSQPLVLQKPTIISRMTGNAPFARTPDSPEVIKKGWSYARSVAWLVGDASLRSHSMVASTSSRCLLLLHAGTLPPAFDSFTPPSSRLTWGSAAADATARTLAAVIRAVALAPLTTTTASSANPELRQSTVLCRLHLHARIPIDVERRSSSLDRYPFTCSARLRGTGATCLLASP